MKFAWFIVYLGVHLSCLSQHLNVTISESYIEIGTPVKITYQVSQSDPTKIEFTPFENSIPTTTKDSSGNTIEGPDLEILKRFSDSLSNKESWIGEYIVTCWDSAIVTVSGPTIKIDGKSLQFENVTLKSDFVAHEKGRDLYEIREKKVAIDAASSNDEESNFWWKYWWLLVIMTLILVLIGIYLIRRKKKPVTEILSLRDRTLRSIQTLENAKLWDKGELKQHYVELSYILRQYLSERYELSLMELTSTEIKIILERNELSLELISNISGILNASDMVKFAKSEPEVYSILKVSGLAKEIVIETSPLEVENVE